MKYSMMIVEFDDKFVSVSRKNNKSAFGFPGGKIDPGETPKEAAIRECFEETGIVISDCELVHIKDQSSYFYTKISEFNPSSTEEGIIKLSSIEELTADSSAFPVQNRQAFKDLALWKEKNVNSQNS